MNILTAHLTETERTFDARRQAFLAALHAMLTTPEVDAGARRMAIDDTIGAVRQMGVALGVTDA